MEAKCNDIILEANAILCNEEKTEANLKHSLLMMENLALREKKVAARENEIRSFRKHGKGARRTVVA